MTDAIRQKYQIQSIERTDPPEGTTGAAWCSYVITQGDNVIRGYRQGNLRTVRSELKNFVQQLNDRRAGKRNPAAPQRRTKRKTH
jgi:hypothetical protein